MLFKDLFGGIRGDEPLKVQEPQGQFAKLDGWLSDDEAKQRFQAAPKIIQATVELERAQHTTCATDEKPFRVDVIRDQRDSLTYLDCSCAGCGKYKKIRVNEITGMASVVAQTQTAADRDIARSAQERLDELERDRERLQAEKWAERNRKAVEAANERTRIMEIERSKRNRDIRVQPRFSADGFEYEFSSSAMPLMFTAAPMGRTLRAQPLRGKPAPKHIDKLGIERAPQASDEEV